MKFEFKRIETDSSWQWQLRNSLKSLEDFERYFELNSAEQEGFADNHFKINVPPYYALIAAQKSSSGRNEFRNPVRQMLMPSSLELVKGMQSIEDPLSERKYSPTSRLVHRYPDRVLFLVTDTCALYCRYCLRKHFTGKDQAFISPPDFSKSIEYIQKNKQIREVILSGGDPLTLSDGQLDRVLGEIRKVDHIEIIRIGSRLPTVCPMRITDDLVAVLKKHKPVFMMTHFNHPDELTLQSAEALEKLVDNGVPAFNQMVLLRGVNNHPAIIQALSRRLLYLRVKPYYMHQCDPSVGTDHFRTSLQESAEIQKQLWGKLSGLAMPNLSIDLPGGGGKVGVTPRYEKQLTSSGGVYQAWDGGEYTYVNPKESSEETSSPLIDDEYIREWNQLSSSGHICKT